MWTTGFFGWAGYGGAWNPFSETLGLIALLVLVAAMLTWLTLPSDHDDRKRPGDRVTPSGEPLVHHGSD